MNRDPADARIGGLKVIGKRLARVDAKERVTGQAIYPADLSLPGMVHAKILRSPLAHARICGIDTTRAQAAEGRACRRHGRRFSGRAGGIHDPHG